MTPIAEVRPVATISPYSWAASVRSQATPGVTENQHSRIVHRGTKGSNPLPPAGSLSHTSQWPSPQFAGARW
jgi:hypothetical protein